MTDLRQFDFDQFSQALPDAVAALRTLSQVSSQGMDKGLIELLKVRVSQINGCAYCLQLHLNWARKAGVPQAKLDRIAVWRETSGFDATERIVLAWAESLTGMGRHGGTEAAYQALQQTFDAQQILRLTVAVATINAWNRIAGPLGFEPPAAT